ncbi:uncharacterized protein [Prorops nasuta]|uniref:uncharacterized protein n=1 Tax=Prorops nasuta TaxID=863751 RepID=UPI0034D005FF
MNGMEVLWNKLNISRPPNCSWRMSKKDCKLDIKKFKRVLEGSIRNLECQEALHTEAAILSRLIYRMKCKFRNDKGLKSMEKLNRALLIYLSLNLVQEYKYVYDFIDADEKDYILPSKQMIQYLLVKVYGFIKLMLHVEEVSRETGNFLKTRISTGHAWTLSIIAYAIVSRIWILSSQLIQKSHESYRNLEPLLKEFKLVGTVWLPSNFSLPYNLSELNNLPCMTNMTTKSFPHKNLQSILFKLIQHQEEISENNSTDINTNVSLDATHNMEIEQNDQDTIEITDECGEILDRNILVVTKPVNNNPQKIKRETKKEKLSLPDDLDFVDDCGEAIDRNDFNKSNTCFMEKNLNTSKVLNNYTKKSRKKSSMEILNVKSTSDLRKLLDYESLPNIDKLQWNIIKNKSKIFLKKIKKCTNEKEKKKLVKHAINCIKRWTNVNAIVK